MAAAGSSPELVPTFGPFQLARARKVLLEDGRPVRLGGRALDLLMALVERPGVTLGRDELVARVWPRTIVEDSSLRVHVAALRKVLGDGQAGARYIVNQPGRGYCFIAPVEMRPELRPVDGRAAASPERSHVLPPRLVRMLGRNDAVAALGARLRARRLVTLVGPGGIGKTTVAIAAAEVHGPTYEEGARFIDLSLIAEPQRVVTALAVSLGLGAAPMEQLTRIAEFLSDKELLLVLDNCEHVVDSLAPLVATLLRAAPRLNVLATSREALRAESEWLHRLPALTVPAADDILAADEAMSYSAIELFVERATASVDTFELNDRDVPVVASLCRRLDGNPLAIELAAARVDLFGLAELSAQLDRHVLHLKRGRRDVSARHETLGAMLNWSYQLLTPAQRRLLQLLSIFRARFPLDAAARLVRAVDGSEGASDQQVLDGVVDLAAKSLLVSDTHGESVYFRLLELPRAFALSELKASGQHEAVARKHAEYVMDFIDRASQVWPRVSSVEWRMAYGWILDDIRAVLAWAFANGGDVLLGSSLAMSIWPLMDEASPLDEAGNIERALAAVDGLPTPNPELEIRLNIAIARMFQLQRGDLTKADPFNARALELARSCQRPELESEVLMMMVLGAMALGNFPLAALHHQELDAVARASGSALHALVADRMGAQAMHLFGDHEQAGRLAEKVLSHPSRKGPMNAMGGSVDHRVSMGAVQARILWLQGFADRAAALADEVLELSAGQEMLTQSQALSFAACPVALWRGDVALAGARIARLRAMVTAYEAGGAWLPTVSAIPWWTLGDTQAVPEALFPQDHLVTAQPDLATAESANRALGGHAGWCAPELLRAYGERLLKEGKRDAARKLFEQSLDIAHGQGALAWSLRSATSLARLLQGLGHGTQARAVLEPIYRRFTEGYTTADLRAAASLLGELQSRVL